MEAVIRPMEKLLDIETQVKEHFWIRIPNTKPTILTITPCNSESECNIGPDSRLLQRFKFVTRVWNVMVASFITNVDHKFFVCTVRTYFNMS